MYLPPGYEFDPDLLEKLRKRKGWTKKRLAAEIGMDTEALRKAIYRYRSGQGPGLNDLQWWVALLKLDAHPIYKLVEREEARDAERGKGKG